MTESNTPPATEQQDRIDALEAENEQLREQLAALRETVEEIESSVESTEQETPVTPSENSGPAAPSSVSRRGALAGLAGLGVLGIGAGSQPVAADDDHDHWGQTWSGNVEGEDGLWVGNYSNEGDGRGLVGRTDAAEGTALHGTAAHEEGDNAGLVGLTLSSSGTGVRGSASSHTGAGIGVDGRSNSPGGVGVRGLAWADSGENYGVEGRTDSDDGYGLYTPDDAKIEGSVETDDEWRVEADTDDGDAGNVVQGHSNNDVGGQVVGSTIAGGGSENAINSVQGDYSFAAGRGAKAMHDGAIVFGDSTDDGIQSNNADEALFQTDLATEGELSFSDGTTQETAGPVAKGWVSEDGSSSETVNVESVTWDDSEDRYEIEFSDFEYDSTDGVAVVTPVDGTRRVGTGVEDKNLVVEFQSGSQNEFHFVVYDL